MRNAELSAIPARMAKAQLPKAEMGDWRELIGAAIERVRQVSGFSLKEFAVVIGRDERQIARWITGAERPQLDALFSVESLRHPLIVALAELAQSEFVQIETHITIRRRA